MHGYTKVIVWLLLLSSSSCYFCHGGDTDVQCLKDLKQSLIDPNGILESSWNFSDNGTDGYVCRFIGVECWHPDENKVLSLRLGNLGLRGSFPRGLELCKSLTTLNLSVNSFSGPLPDYISQQMSYLTSLDLSYNRFSDEIPGGMANMTYLNLLYLNHNQFTGRIPGQISDLARLYSFNIADNLLSGPIPDSLQQYPSTSPVGNRGLCGPPLDQKCKRRFRVRIWVWPARFRVRLHRINDASSIGAAAGFFVGFVVAFYFPHWFICCGKLQPYLFRVCALYISLYFCL